MNFRQLLAELNHVYDDCAETFAASVVNEVSEWAAVNGYPDLVRDRVPAAQVVEVRRYLAAAIAATRTTTLPTPPEVAKQLGADPATVIQWIRSGQLKASNLATGHRPRYVVQPSDLDTFLKARQPVLRRKGR